MKSITRILTQPEAAEDAPDFAHYAQLELQHLQVIEMLDSAEKDDREVIRQASERKRHTIIPFASATRKAAEEIRQAESELENIRFRLAEEHHTLVSNRHHLHTELHVWLLKHDADYAKADAIESMCEDIRSEIRPLVSLLVDLLSRYGATRNEIAVAYDSRTHMMSTVALSALDRLIHSYDLFREAQERLANRIDGLNEFVDDTMFNELKLCIFEQIVPPDCRSGMDYAQMYANFEQGAETVRNAIRRLNDYFGHIEATPTMMGNILYNYREELWTRHMLELRAGDEETPPKGLDRLSA